jgi:hypothetical protein
MNRPAVLAATATTSESSPSAQAEHPMALWAFITVPIAIASTVLVLDSSMTVEQRITLFIQSGMFP